VSKPRASRSRAWETSSSTPPPAVGMTPMRIAHGLSRWTGRSRVPNSQS
jgi:hypothetical protein